MSDFDIKELSKLESQLQRLRQALPDWERNGTFEQVKMGRAFVKSLQEQIADLRLPLAA